MYEHFEIFGYGTHVRLINMNFMAAGPANPSSGGQSGFIHGAGRKDGLNSSSSIKPLGRIDLILVLFWVAVVLFSYFHVDELIWRLYHPRDGSSLSIYDPAGRSLVDVLGTHYDVTTDTSDPAHRAWTGTARLVGSRRSSVVSDANFLNVRFAGPASGDSVTSSSRLSWDVDGMLITSGMRGVSLVVALYLDGSVEVPISGGNVIQDMDLTQRLHMEYDLLEGVAELLSGPHDVAVKITIAPHPLSLSEEGVREYLAAFGCRDMLSSLYGSTTAFGCSVIDHTVFYYTGPISRGSRAGNADSTQKSQSLRPDEERTSNADASTHHVPANMKANVKPSKTQTSGASGNGGGDSSDRSAAARWNNRNQGFAASGDRSVPQSSGVKADFAPFASEERGAPALNSRTSSGSTSTFTSTQSSKGAVDDLVSGGVSGGAGRPASGLVADGGGSPETTPPQTPSSGLLPDTFTLSKHVTIVSPRNGVYSRSASASTATTTSTADGGVDEKDDSIDFEVLLSKWAYDELVASARRSYASGNAAMLGGDSTASVPKYELHFLHNTGYAVEMTPLVLNREATRFEDDGLVLVRTSMRHSVEGGGGSAVHVMKVELVRREGGRLDTVAWDVVRVLM